MALKSTDPERHPPTNARLGPVLARWAGEPSRAHRAELLECLVAGPLLVALHELPPGFDPAQGEATPARFVTAELPEHGTVLCAFSSGRALAAKAPAAVGLALDPATLLDWTVEAGMPGLLLDPEGAAFFVTQDDARALLGLPARRGRGGRAVSLSEEPENAVRAALEHLLEPGAAAAAVSVSETRTGKRVLFSREPDGGLLMVLPAEALTRDERTRARMLFDELAGPTEDLPPDPAAAEREAASDFRALFGGDAARPAKAAIKVFTWIFGFLPGFALALEEGAGPTPHERRA
jgi:hypothetical protein